MAEYDSFIPSLECSELEPDRLVVISLRGRERLSSLYRYELVVQPRDGVPLILDDVTAMMEGAATITWGPDRDHPVHGVIREVETLPTHEASLVRYRLTLVPRLWDAQLTRGSWIYQDQSVTETIEAALSETLPEAAAFVAGTDFELATDGSYTPREYVVQYEESVFDFVSRQAEHWGIHYSFDHLGETEKVVFGDTNRIFEPLAGYESIAYEPRHGVLDRDEGIFELGVRYRRVEHQVSLRDYNYRIPGVDLVTEPVPVDETGVGDVHVTGDHFWTPAEGSALAGIRSEELFCRKARLHGASRVRGLRPGHRFAVDGALAAELELAREVLVVGVEHSYERGRRGGEDVPYDNRLELLPLEMTFRPPRRTPKPRLYGVMHAKIDSEADDDGLHAPCDEWGRYKVVMPFDVAGETGGKASCWIRLATAAGGGGFGFTQQLHVGNEVALYHIDGDPDRPVIGGALPNFENKSMVTRSNANQAVIRMRGGMAMTFSD